MSAQELEVRFDESTGILGEKGASGTGIGCHTGRNQLTVSRKELELAGLQAIAMHFQSYRVVSLDPSRGHDSLCGFNGHYVGGSLLPSCGFETSESLG